MISLIIYAITLTAQAGPYDIEGLSQGEIQIQLARFKTCIELEKVIREGFGSQKLGRIAIAFRNNWRRNGDPVQAYGTMRAYFLMMSSMQYFPKGLPGASESRDMTGIFEIALKVPKLMPHDPWALSGYYWWLTMNGEPGWKRPVERAEDTTVQVNGKAQKAKLYVVIRPSEDRARRLGEVFQSCLKLDPRNPLVLQIASLRETRSTLRSYNLICEAYERGGKELFPEDSLYSMFDLAAKLKRTNEVEKHRQSLLQHLRGNPKSLWTKYFYARHPDFPK